MIFTQRESISLEQAFATLTEAAFSQKNVRGSAVELRRHPFDFTMKMDGARMYYFYEAEAMVRVLTRRIGEWRKSGQRISRLRKFVAGNKDKHAIYYEAFIGDVVLLCGSCGDYNASVSRSRDTMEGIFTLLTITYQLAAETVEVPFENGSPVAYIEEFISHEALSKGSEDQPPRGATFKRGDKVRFAAQASEEGPFVVDCVEHISYHCTCGLNKEIPLELHPEQCSRRIRHKEKHHQFIYVVRGKSRCRFSGFYFELVS